MKEQPLHWHFGEEHSAQSLALMFPPHDISAPDCFCCESTCLSRPREMLPTWNVEHVEVEEHSLSDHLMIGFFSSNHF